MRALLLLCLVPCLAQAEFLPGAARAIPQSDSASRDAPVFELAYGPNPQASLGGELGVWRHRGKVVDFRLSGYTLAAFENGQSQRPPPVEFGRILFGATGAFAFPLPLGLMEASIGLGRSQAFQMTNVVADATHVSDIPFGAGGSFVAVDVAWQTTRDPWSLTLRAGDRIHLPTFARMFGQTVAVDAFSDATADALIDEPSLDAVLRWKASVIWQPLLALHGGLLDPNDGFTRRGVFGRAMLGVSFPGAHGELLPFLSADIGNGLGMLVNRHELRFSLGVRYALF
jgi:hypothetical protein